MAGETSVPAASRVWRHSPRRLLRHLFTGHWTLHRDFPTEVRAAIEQAVTTCEREHSGEIRVVLEAALHPLAVWHGMTPRARAVDLFSHLRVWDTEHNNGVLVYLLLADRTVEVIADRGVAGGRVQASEWSDVCRLMEGHFRAGDFRQGGVAGIQAVAAILARHFPGSPNRVNELPDAPLILG